MIGASMPADAESHNSEPDCAVPPSYLMPLPASALPLSRHGLDRDYLARSAPDLFESLRLNPRMRQLVLWKNRALLGAGGELDLLPHDTALDATLRLYLGRSLEPDQQGDPIIAVIVDDDAASTLAPLESDPGQSRWGDLRALGSSFSDSDAGLFTAALALANWHDSHQFSPRTGMATIAGQGGWVRTDVESGREVFPRTDPAIIVGIVDAGDRLLLGHNAMWPANRYSLLAGFVEPGSRLRARSCARCSRSPACESSTRSMLGRSPGRSRHPSCSVSSRRSTRMLSQPSPRMVQKSLICGGSAATS